MCLLPEQQQQHQSAASGFACGIQSSSLSSRDPPDHRLFFFATSVPRFAASASILIPDFLSPSHLEVIPAPLVQILLTSVIHSFLSQSVKERKKAGCEKRKEELVMKSINFKLDSIPDRVRMWIQKLHPCLWIVTCSPWPESAKVSLVTTNWWPNTSSSSSFSRIGRISDPDIKFQLDFQAWGLQPHRLLYYLSLNTVLAFS